MSIMTRGIIGRPYNLAMHSDMSRRQFYSHAQVLLAERDQFNEELSACKEGPGTCGYWREAARAHLKEIDQLKAENERLRKDDLRAGLMALAAYIGPICTAAVYAAMGKGEQA